jgi:hypothetical protein
MKRGIRVDSALTEKAEAFLKLFVARNIEETPDRVNYGCFITRDLHDPYPTPSFGSEQI